MYLDMTLYALAIAANSRSKAVWSSKRILSTVLILTFAFASSAMAAGPRSRGGRVHRVAPNKVRPGRPNAFVQPYKMDSQVTYLLEDRDQER